MRAKSPETKFSKPKYRLGLALSGGGTRGFAHVGVLKALIEENIPVYCVAGTSIGSLIGALYCAGVGTDAIVHEAKLVDRRELLGKFWVNSDSANIERLANRMLLGKTFDELATPFAAVAVDILSGEEVVLDSGNVSKAISASCAVPAIFTPVELDGHLLVDGGLLNNMPADVCRRMGADVVVGVDLNHNRGQGARSKHLHDILIATWTITTKSTMYKGQMNSDLVLEPELREFKRTSLENIDEMVTEGYRVAKKYMPQIKSLVEIG